MAWEEIGSLHGAALGTVGVVAANDLSKGDPLVWRDDGKVMKKVGGTDTVKPRFLALADCVAGETISVKPLTKNTRLRIACESGAARGGQYGLNVTTLTIDKDNTTQKMVEILDLESATVAIAVALGWGEAGVQQVDTDVTSLDAAVGDTQSVVTWTDPTTTTVDHILVYVVKTSDSTAVTGSPFTVAAAAGTKTVTGLTNGTGYTVTVKSVDTDGNVSPGAVDTVTPSA